MTTIKLPYLGPTGKALLIAAWTRNELEKRLAWISPTYTQWNPKLPWGTDYETLTEQPPEIPMDSTNARLEPWRRWNWMTDGTPNKWLNVPYEYPWNMAAGQYSTYWNLTSENYWNQFNNMSGPNPLPVATPDLAVWNPSSYVSRPAPPESVSTVTDGDSYQFTGNKKVLAERYEVMLTRSVKCESGAPSNPNYKVKWYTAISFDTRVKGATYDENNNVISWPQMVNPNTGVSETIYGTLYSWGQKVTTNRDWKKNLYGKRVISGNRVTNAVCRWNIRQETYVEDDRHMERVYFEDVFANVRAGYEYYCSGLELVTKMYERTAYSYVTKVYERPSGFRETITIDFTDEFKYGSYQKKTPYPCYLKQPRPADRRYWDYRQTNLQEVEGAELTAPTYTLYNFTDAKPEAYGGGNVRLEVDGQDDAPNTWYARYRYKPSQHWADGWGIRCESANFYWEPEYRVGRIFNSADDINATSLEQDPITKEHNIYFWQGMHKDLYPMFTPGQYIGTSPVGDEGIPRVPNIPPNDNEDLYDYQQRTASYVVNLTTNYIYGAWFTMPVHHYSANDMWKNLCKQNNVAFRVDRPDEVVAAMQAATIPGQPDIFQPPYPSMSMLDTTFIFNQNTLVPTDFVHASMQPLPVFVTGTDAEFVAVRTPEEPKVRLDIEPIFDPATGDLEWTRFKIDGEIEFQRTNGDAAVMPIFNPKVSMLPTVRPPFATLANYPTGWEIHPNHYKTHQARLIGETEMNHRCESIPNWLDTDGGFLYYFTEGIRASNEAQVERTTFFYFLRQARLPSYHDTHQGISVKVELLFRRKTLRIKYNEVGRSKDTEIFYEVERYEVDLKFPDDQTLDPTFDPTYYPKDTDPGRQEKNPSKTPSRWWMESTLPAYDIYKVDMNRGSAINGKVEDKRDWQTAGPYKTTVVSIPTYKLTTSPAQRVPWWSYSRNVYTYVQSPNVTPNTSYEDRRYNPAYWGSYTNEQVENVFLGWTESVWEETTLEFIGIQITNINGPVYRSYGANRPPGSDPP